MKIEPLFQKRSLKNGKVTITVDRKVARRWLNDCSDTISYFLKELNSTRGVAHERIEEYLEAWINAQQELERVLKD